MNISETVTVITGAASGIGATCARVLAAKGSRLVLADVNEQALERVRDEVQQAGGEALIKLTNVTDEADVAALMDMAIDHYGAINVVLPCAGIFRDAFMVKVKEGKTVKTMSLEKFQSVIDVNLTGTFLTLREAASRMVDHACKGVLFTISSINKEGELGQLNYAATKVAVGLWPKILVGEFFVQDVQDIRVVGIAPGMVNTPILQGMPDHALDQIMTLAPMGRLIEPEELVATIAHVIENEAITGTTLEVAGGVLSRGMPK